MGHGSLVDETKPDSPAIPMPPDPRLLPALGSAVIPAPNMPTSSDILPAVHTIPVPDQSWPQHDSDEKTPPSGNLDREPTVLPETIARNASGCHGHGPSYQWLTGELHYLYVRGLWQLFYADTDDNDRFAGSVILSTTEPMSGFRDGETVRVKGAMLDQPEPTYRVFSIRHLPQTTNP